MLWYAYIHTDRYTHTYLVYLVINTLISVLNVIPSASIRQNCNLTIFTILRDKLTLYIQENCWLKMALFYASKMIKRTTDNIAASPVCQTISQFHHPNRCEEGFLARVIREEIYPSNMARRAVRFSSTRPMAFLNLGLYSDLWFI